MTGFALDPRLAADCYTAGALPLSELLLANDRRFPWAILVPRRPALVELTDLAAEDRRRLMDETASTSAALRLLTGADKTNIAALGNQVRQLHVHVIARFPHDEAWPNPVWGRGVAVHYPLDEAQAFAKRLFAAVSADLSSAP